MGEPARERPRSQLSQRRSRETRARLVEAARDQFVRRGFDETTVNDLCDAAGVTVGAFYFYFDAKEDLLLELASAGSELTWEHWERLAPTETPTAEVMGALLDGMSERAARVPKPLLTRAIKTVLPLDRGGLPTGTGHDFHAVFAAVLKRGLARGEVAAATKPHDVASMLTVVVLQAMAEWAVTGRPTLAALVTRRAVIVLRGVGIA